MKPVIMNEASDNIRVTVAVMGWTHGGTAFLCHEFPEGGCCWAPNTDKQQTEGPGFGP